MYGCSHGKIWMYWWTAVVVNSTWKIKCLWTVHWPGQYCYVSPTDSLLSPWCLPVYKCRQDKACVKNFIDTFKGSNNFYWNARQEPKKTKENKKKICKSMLTATDKTKIIIYQGKTSQPRDQKVVTASNCFRYYFSIAFQFTWLRTTGCTRFNRSDSSLSPSRSNHCVMLRLNSRTAWYVRTVSWATGWSPRAEFMSRLRALALIAGLVCWGGDSIVGFDSRGCCCRRKN